MLRDTRTRLHDAGLSLWLGPTLWDLDEPQDLPRLQTIPGLANRRPPGIIEFHLDGFVPAEAPPVIAC